MAINFEGQPLNPQNQPQGHQPQGGNMTENQLAQALNMGGQNPNQQAQEPVNTGRGRNGEFSWFNMGALAGRRISTNPLGEALKKAEDAILSYWEKSFDSNVQIDLLPIDKDSTPNLAVSCLVAVQHASEDPKSPIAYHTLIIGGSVEDFPSRRVQIQGFTLDVVDLTSDAYDPVMRKVIRQAVLQSYPEVDPDKIHDADAEVVGRDFDFSDELAVHYLTLNCALATRNALDVNNDDFHDLSLIKARPDSSLSLVVKYHQGHEKDYVGEPVRSDITVEVKSSPLAQENRFRTSQQTIARATGFIDLLWNQTNQNMMNPYLATFQQPNPYTGFAGMQNPLACYQANFVLTSLMPMELQTLPALLWTLISAAYVGENNNWIGALRPIYDGSGRLPLHNIGAIGYDVKPTGEAAPIVTTPDQFGIADLQKLVAAYFHPGLAISIDVPQTGAQSWALGVFGAAASGDKDAMDAIREAADHLLGGNFSKYYQGSGQFVFSNDNLILNGHYTDDKGNQRDIRDIDYLVVAGELGGKDANLLVDWTNSFSSRQFDPTLRAHTRQQIIQSLRPSAVFTGKSLRVTFESAFIMALLAGAQQCNYWVNAQFPDNTLMVHERANADYIAGAILNGFHSNLFRTGAFMGNQGTGFATRWNVR